MDELRRLLELEETGPGCFRGRTPESRRPQVYGGQLAGQAVAAAFRTVDPARVLHSLHGCFLRRGDPRTSIDYEVEVTRDGRAVSTRTVRAHQGAGVTFTAVCSFRTAVEGGPGHQEPLPQAPDPESLPTLPERIANDPSGIPGMHEWGGFDVRWVGDPRHGVTPGHGRVSCNQVWIRVLGRLPDDAALHASGLVYLSDISMLTAMRQPYGLAVSDPRLKVSSVDHAIWLHRPARIDEWLLYDQSSPSRSRDLSLAHGRLFSRDGALVASVMQEGLWQWF